MMIEERVVLGRGLNKMFIVMMMRIINSVVKVLLSVDFVFMFEVIIDFGGVIVDGKYLKKVLMKLYIL